MQHECEVAWQGGWPFSVFLALSVHGLLLLKLPATVFRQLQEGGLQAMLGVSGDVSVFPGACCCMLAWLYVSVLTSHAGTS